MLHFDIDQRQLQTLINELGLTEKQAKFALSRALRRTAATLRRMAERGLKSELNVKRVSFLRRRLKSIAFRRASLEGMRLWFGSNDMAVSALRGALSEDGEGASFSGRAGSKHYPGGFIAKGKRYGRTIFVRRGKKRLPLDEAEVPVKDKIDTFVEDEIFDKVNEIFWGHFERDMLARMRYGVGRR